ncbi:MAG TPA: flagellar motor protein MotB [Stellaceae bacterium]|nr:flagellar motor protein MotB [Stellaceae bacterium]
MANRNEQTVIIKRVKVKGHGGHHGGAWKVAYADFVTAMMSFFLLLWLLNVTTDVQKRGIADYFQPTISSKSESGAGGVLGGLTIGQPGSETDPQSQPALDLSRLALPQANDSDDDNSNDGGTVGKDPQQQNAGDQPGKTKLDDKQLEQQLANREQKRFEAAAQALREAIKDVPELQKLADNLIIDNTPEGLRIQLVDQDRQPMYPLGSAEMLDPAKKLMALVSQIVLRLPNKIAITGHTDSTPYPVAGKYSNWELSSDRANASRREFVADGVPADRIARVSGLADQDPLDAKDPAAPRNRRISIVLLREAKEMQPDADAAATKPPQPAATNDPPSPDPKAK